MHISSAFEAGAIEVVRAHTADDVHLRIRSDSHADFRQWFYFCVTDVRGQTLRLHLDNASECTYPYGWPGYEAVISFDRLHWQRAPTRYVDGVLIIDIECVADRVWVAYFEPYPEQRHHDVLGQLAAHPQAQVRALGLSLQGRTIDVVQIGQTDPAKAQVWVVARQHPGETMAQWCAEGMLLRLLDRTDALSQRLLRQAVFHVVPNINPDGSALGNLRSNAAGVNLNREWLQPSLQRSPEVLYVREQMHRTGVDLFLDLHGDETIPHVFVDGNSMLPGRTEVQNEREQHFVQDLLAHSPDFQLGEGYAPDRFSDEMLTLASKYVGHSFGCLALTLEMPFKDHLNNPLPGYGWTAQRSKKLGADLLWPIARDLERI